MIVHSEYFYWMVGCILAITGVMILTDKTHSRRISSSAFWFIIAALFLFSDWLPPALTGACVVVAALIAGFGGLGRGKPNNLPEQQRQASAMRLGNRLFVPALIVPVGTLIGSIALPKLKIAAYSARSCCCSWRRVTGRLVFMRVLWLGRMY